MFDIDESKCVTAQEKLLFNIYSMLCASTIHDNTPKKPEGEFIGICPKCGREWHNAGERLACTRKHKKEGK